jgi:hypothetical protein
MRPWWETHPKSLWTAEDWRAARRAGVVPPLPGEVVDPAVKLLAESTPKLSWGPPADPADARRRAANDVLEKAGAAAAPLAVTDLHVCPPRVRDKARGARAGSPPRERLECQSRQCGETRKAIVGTREGREGFPPTANRALAPPRSSPLAPCSSSVKTLTLPASFCGSNRAFTHRQRAMRRGRLLSERDKGAKVGSSPPVPSRPHVLFPRSTRVA